MFLGATSAHPRPGLGGGGRVSAVELRLPELPGRARRAPAGASRARQESRGSQRRRRRPGSLLNASPGDPRSRSRAFPGLHPRAPAALADRRHRPHQRRPRSHARVCSRCASRSRSSSTPPSAVRRGFIEGNVLYRTLERFPGQVTWRPLELGPRGGARRRRRASRSGSRSKRVRRRRASCPCTSRGSRRRDPRTTSAFASASDATGRRSPTCPRVGGVTRPVRRGARAAPTACSSTAPSGRATSCRARASAPSAPRTWRTCRSAGQAAASRSSAGLRAARARLHPHQQHQPDPARGLARARAR